MLPSGARTTCSRAPSTSIDRGSIRPRSSPLTASSTAALGTVAMTRPFAGSLTVSLVSRMSSGGSPPRRNPSQARAAPPSAICTPPSAFTAAVSRCVSQASSSGPSDNRQARTPRPAAAKITSASASCTRACSSRPPCRAA